MSKLAIILLVLCSLSAIAAPPPYDESADAKAQVQQALAEAKRANLSVLLIFGANWCPDCHALDTSLKSGKNAELMAKSFKVVKVNVGRYDRNMDLVKSYGNPIERGIPAAVVLSPANEILYSTREGELSKARRMSESGVYDFFSRVVESAKSKTPASK